MPSVKFEGSVYLPSDVNTQDLVDDIRVVLGNLGHSGSVTATVTQPQTFTSNDAPDDFAKLSFGTIRRRD